MKITAKFIGENSLGYEHGKEYVLSISIIEKVQIVRLQGSGLCIYDSINSFLANWANIRTIKDWV